MKCCEFIIEYLKHYINTILTSPILYREGTSFTKEDILVKELKKVFGNEKHTLYVVSDSNQLPCSDVAKCEKCGRVIYLAPFWKLIPEELKKFGVNIELRYVCIDCVRKETNRYQDDVEILLDFFCDIDKYGALIKALLYPLHMKYLDLCCTLCRDEKCCKAHELMTITLLGLLTI